MSPSMESDATELFLEACWWATTVQGEGKKNYRSEQRRLSCPHKTWKLTLMGRVAPRMFQPGREQKRDPRRATRSG